MIKVAVCDDDREDLKRMKDGIDAVQENMKISFDAPVDYFSSGEDLTAAIRRGQEYTLCILDVYMGGMTGIETARVVRDYLPGVHIGFMTSSEEFALDAIDLNAIHYMITPATPAKVAELFQRFIDRAKIPARIIELETETKTYTFPLHLIEKIMSANKGVDVYIHNVEDPEHMNLAFMKAEEQLAEFDFLRVSRGVLINMDYINSIENEICRMKDGTEFLISRREKAAIRKQYNDYLFSRISPKD